MTTSGTGAHGYSPVIKWTGSKRPVARHIGQLFPSSHKYFEPFVGGGAVLPFRPASAAVAGDSVPELVSLWILIRDAPDLVAAEYRARWTRLQRCGHEEYSVVRDRFNRDRSPHDLLFLTRTCANGLIRFNRHGNFNNSLHHGRPGIDPSKFEPIVFAWSRGIQDVDFIAADYRDTLASVQKGDAVFLDPPYSVRRGRYAADEFDLGALFVELERLNTVGARWVLTLDGTAGDRTYGTDLPKDLYLERHLVTTGTSPFARTLSRRLDVVGEWVYANFKHLRSASREALAQQLSARSLETESPQI